VTWPPAPVAPGEIARILAETPAGPLAYALARRALEACGVEFCRERNAATEDEAVAAAEAIGYPVVVKADVADLLHKTEAAAVHLDVRDAHSVREVFRDARSRLGAPRVLVQEQVTAGVELLLGARRDEVFGPLVAVGTGGILAEAIGDVALALAPVGADEARALLHQGVRGRLLAGVRGRPACDDAPLVDAIVAVGGLIATCPRVVEIDVNPVIASSTRAVAVDALVILGDAPGGGL
jgi:acetyltransferase